MVSVISAYLYVSKNPEIDKQYIAYKYYVSSKQVCFFESVHFSIHRTSGIIKKIVTAL